MSLSNLLAQTSHKCLQMLDYMRLTFLRADPSHLKAMTCSRVRGRQNISAPRTAPVRRAAHVESCRQSSNQAGKTRLRCGASKCQQLAPLSSSHCAEAFPVTVCEKSDSLDWSPASISNIESDIKTKTNHSPWVKDLPFSAPSSNCPPAEFNMCRLIGCDEIGCPGRIVLLNLGHLVQ